MTLTITGFNLPLDTITIGSVIYLLVDYDPRRKVALFAPWRSLWTLRIITNPYHHPTPER